MFNAEWQETDPFRAQFIRFDVDSYLTDFQRLWWLSPGEIEAGTLNREAEKVGRRISREPVSRRLFDDLRTWRYDLFRYLSKYNKLISPKQIDEAVLRILNRLIFIRTAEDRLVEPPRLRPLVRELKDSKKINDLPVKLKELFREFDSIYNSELFAPHFSEELNCESQPYIDIIEGLYERDFIRYNFNAIDADVLGTAYEQYLGHVISDPKAAEVVEKHTKRKSQGIYYTPSFVVKYIVQQTLGRHLEEKGYDPSRPVRVLDMACGSGSFLIEAFDVLDAYIANLRHQSHAAPMRSGRANPETFDDFARRMEILGQCIYGVDLDGQAVAIARLNLLLRALHSREKLPMLQNIRLGNSLVSGSPDELMKYFGKEWRLKTPFNWEKEFIEVFTKKDQPNKGGFDVVIGNPPYVRQESLGDEFKVYAKDHFTTYTGTADLYIYFIEQAHKLLRPDGLFGMICSNKFMRSNYGKALRDFLINQTTLLEIIDFGELPVFASVATFPSIIITRKQPTKLQQPLHASIKKLDFEILSEEIHRIGTILDDRSLQGDNWSLADSGEHSIFDKMRNSSISLGEFVENRIYRGVVTGCNDVFVINEVIRNRIINEDPKSSKVIKPFVVGDDVRKYRINIKNTYLILTRRGIKISEYPAVYEYLLKHKKLLLPKPIDYKGLEWQGRKPGNYHWYEIQDTVDYYAEFEKPKIVYPDIAKESRVAYDTESLYFGNTVYFIPSDDLYLLGVLNSKLIFAFFKRISSVLGDADKGGRLRWFRQDVMKIPIRNLDMTIPAEKARHDTIVKLVTEMLTLQKEYVNVEKELDDRRHALQRRIDEMDREIDKLVYQLYGLTDEDIRIVEGTTSQ